MKKLVLMCGILVGVVSVSLGAMSEEELERVRYNCFQNEDKSACQALINDGLPSVKQCVEQWDKDGCSFVGGVYSQAGRLREAIPYFEKAIILGNNRGYYLLGITYYDLQDYYNAKKYHEIGCNKGNGDFVQLNSCYDLGTMYIEGKGVRQDYTKARELYKKACDMKLDIGCYGVAALYYGGAGVRQNLSIAKQYFGKACDLGEQKGCDKYRELNQAGVQ